MNDFENCTTSNYNPNRNALKSLGFKSDQWSKIFEFRLSLCRITISLCFSVSIIRIFRTNAALNFDRKFSKLFRPLVIFKPKEFLELRCGRGIGVLNRVTTNTHSRGTFGKNRPRIWLVPSRSISVFRVHFQNFRNIFISYVYRTMKSSFFRISENTDRPRWNKSKGL